MIMIALSQSFIKGIERYPTLQNANLAGIQSIGKSDICLEARYCSATSNFVKTSAYGAMNTEKEGKVNLKTIGAQPAGNIITHNYNNI